MICALLLFKFILVDISPPTNGTEISLLPSKEIPFILIGTANFLVETDVALAAKAPISLGVGLFIAEYTGFPLI